jgi:small multidrug resistance pump
MKRWTFLCIAIISEVVATSALKATEDFMRLWPSIAGIALIVSGVVIMNVYSTAIPH